MRKAAIAMGCTALLGLAGCLQIPDVASRSAVATPAVPALAAAQTDGAQSSIINGLIDRRSVLPTGPFTTVAQAVITSNHGVAASDLRAAKLRAEARDRNWLPTLGPQVSLTSLGAIVSSLVVEQVLFDNGRKRAERAYAAADVEVAAVSLSKDTNDRILAALELYLTAQAAQARAAVNASAIDRMRHFEYVMDERVKGGVSNRVDLQIVQQKLNQMQSDMASDYEIASRAMAELATMADGPMDHVTGVSDLRNELLAEPLDVMKARAEAARTVAELTAARSGFLPGLTAQGSVGSGGNTAGLTLGAPNGLGFGLGADLGAIDAQRDAAQARVAQVQEDSNRRLAALEGELASLQRQAQQAQTLAAQAAANYDIFAQQQQAGQRAVPEVVGVFETKVRTAREAASLRYEAARIALRIAAMRGVLVDGDTV